MGKDVDYVSYLDFIGSMAEYESVLSRFYYINDAKVEQLERIQEGKRYDNSSYV